MRHRIRWRLAVWGSRRAFVGWLLSPAVSSRLPALPRWVLARLDVEPPIGARSLAIPPLPPSLATAPGIPRDPEQEAAAFADDPLPVWIRRYPAADEYNHRRNWIALLLVAGLRARAKSGKGARRGNRADLSAAQLTTHIKEQAAQLGFSAVGLARYNPMYTFDPDPDSDRKPGDIVIVCVLEQNWAATQVAPSVRTELAHNTTYAREEVMVRQLADDIERLGYKAVPGNAGVAIHYGVEAGLGQLGLNGQLLTPFAGSRCRLMLIRTDAPLIVDRPVDYGIPAICDACQVCVQRCPSGAITNQRKWHRGVLKAKIKIERCLPIVAQVSGCAICMKVCPVQRFGLPAVLEEYATSGRILGKGSDELEGYVWPADGTRYGPGEKPKEAISLQLLRPIEFDFDPRPTRPGTRLTADGQQ